MISRIENAVHDSMRAGVIPTAVVLGHEQFDQVRAEAHASGLVSTLVPPPTRILGLSVLLSCKVAGPLVVADDVRHSLQSLGLFEAVV
jgi:hypothetical protein